MWLLATRNRPHFIPELIRACETSQVPRDVAIMVDGGERQDEYRELQIPDDWAAFYAAERFGMVGCVNSLKNICPGRPWYGILCDHARPRTEGWADALAEAAGDENIAWCNDNIYHGKWPQGAKYAEPGEPHLCGAVCLGGKLVEKMGWVLPPFLKHLCSDNVLEVIGGKLGRLRYLPDVVVERASVSGEDKNPRLGGDYEAFEAWRASSDAWIDSLA